MITSTVKDAGMKSHREFKITEFEPDDKIRWAEQSKNIVTGSRQPWNQADLTPTVIVAR